jgi:hypothetical protein
MISLTRFCAYRFPKERGWPANTKAVSYRPIPLTDEMIDSYFNEDERLAGPFHRFRAQEAEGWILADGTRWVSYGWITNCAKFVPPHFGRNIAAPMDWIFYCGTHPDYRGQGAFTSLLLHMANTRLNIGRELYLDTLMNNTASRRAVAKAGFEPRGMMWSLSMRIPKRPPLIWTGWNPNKMHPAIP